MKKKIIISLMSLLLACTMFLGIGSNVKAGVGDTIADTFPDPNMAQAVADSIAGGNVNTIITQNLVNSTDTLNLDNKNITNIDGIGVFNHLFSLSLKNNQLTSIPESIEEISELTYLYLNNNQLTELPDSLTDLSNLMLLQVPGNQLTKLGDLTKLESLLVINISNNHLIDFPQEQYDFVVNNPPRRCTMTTQIYEEVLSASASLGEDFYFEALPAYEQFPNYGVIFDFTLICPDGSSISVTPDISNGIIQLNGSLLSQQGTYTLQSNGTGGNLSPVTYTHTFNVNQVGYSIYHQTENSDGSFSLYLELSYYDEIDSEVLPQDKVLEIPGYTYNYSNPEYLLLNEMPENNIMNMYYTRNNQTYTIHYLDKVTGASIQSDAIKGGKFNDEVSAQSEIITIEGYTFSDSSTDTLILGTDNSENELYLYYIKNSSNNTNKKFTLPKTGNISEFVSFAFMGLGVISTLVISRKKK